MPAPMEKELYEHFRKQEHLKRIRHVLDVTLGHPVWWLCQRISRSPRHRHLGIAHSFELWKDPRVKRPGHLKKIFHLIGGRASRKEAFRVDSRSLGQIHVLPLFFQQRLVGSMILSGVKAPGAPHAIKLLSEYAHLLIEGVFKSGEVNRLSETIRPRAVALSTVHTVHRIINSTLNLDELVSRLAHLTAQVLRVQRCAIYLLDASAKPGKKPLLVCKARVGYPGRARNKTRSHVAGRLEKRVARHANFQFHKRVLCIPLIDEDVIGAVTVYGKKDKKDFNHFDLEILKTLAEEAVIAIKNAQLYEEQRRVTLGTIQSLALVLGSRIPQKSTMSPEAFARLAILTAQALKLTDEQAQALHYAALLKETTKIGIPEEILKKSSKLTGEELSSIRTHTIQGAKIVQNFENLRNVAPIILYSREKYDGSGYPEGLKGTAIPIGARILSVINAFEAIVMGRPYRGQLSRAEAIKELEKNSGTQFDPSVVEAFVRIVKIESSQKRLTNASP